MSTSMRKNPADLELAAAEWPRMDPHAPDAKLFLGKSMGRFFGGSGPLEERNEALCDWIERRTANGVWPYGLRTLAAPGTEAMVRHSAGTCIRGINLTMVDYLGLSRDERLKEAAIRAIHEFGVHTPSSGPLMGNSIPSCELEQRVAAFLGRPSAFLCPTGWAAAFAAISGVVRPHDFVVMDEIAHQSLQQAAYASTPNVQLFRHLDNNHLEERLRALREEHPREAVLVVTEGLFSMDGDAPHFGELVEICRRHEALVLADVAHDLGATGPGGTGSIGAHGLMAEVDIVAGSFSKSFGTNGGFISSKSPAVEWPQLCFGGPYTYSTAMSPVQVAIAREALEIVAGDEGDRLRAGLMDNVLHLRRGAEARGLGLFGVPSPIVSVFIGKETRSRVAGMLSFHAGLIATCLEFPVVQRGAARYRLSLSPRFTHEQLDAALDIVAASIEQAAAMLDAPAVLAA